ncbi:LysR substrate-binding domain-containing protein [Mesorhizobium qingshengii]|uniref:LysR substrate-binding domain-containing protein n=1 Tax=Mesorhizobium qingshengii TaxID=1165689 RepID=A0ABT4QY87_9HYPH|nr:LysR substrate-binding domain-containing protein [Mesorhizobium qingshengii]MCZ8546543.1 LysR substrate-binding domain-containing protein [Mesorhizobium qingshengii]
MCDEAKSMFDLRQLQLFTAVAEFGSFSRAAVALSVSQPVLSRQIKSLEESVGIALLYRNGRGIVLTEAGKLLQSYATAILEQSSRAASELGALRSNPRGAIVLGMPPSVGVVLTAPLVQHFREQFPQVSMRVVEGFSGHLLEWLVMGKIDVAVLYNAPRMNNLLAEPILRDELFLLGAKDDPCKLGSSPVDAAVVSKIPMILPARPHGLRVLLDQIFGSVGIEPKIEVEVEAMPSTLRLVEAGMGYTILSYSSCHDLVAEGRISYWRIQNPSIERELLLATSSQRPTTTVIRALTTLIRDEVRALRKMGIWEPKA